jgi:hypothetical protein
MLIDYLDAYYAIALSLDRLIQFVNLPSSRTLQRECYTLRVEHVYPTR